MEMERLFVVERVNVIGLGVGDVDVKNLRCMYSVVSLVAVVERLRDTVIRDIGRCSLTDVAFLSS